MKHMMKTTIKLYAQVEFYYAPPDPASGLMHEELLVEAITIEGMGGVEDRIDVTHEVGPLQRQLLIDELKNNSTQYSEYE